MFEISENIISDSLVFMLHAYHSGNYEKFAFWRRQFEKVVKVDPSDCECKEIVLSTW
jgi:hypothetical protein